MRKDRIVYVHSLLTLILMGLAVLVPQARADDARVPEGLSSSDWSSIRAAYEAHRHAAYADEAVPGHFRAKNPRQQWVTRFDGRGFSTTPNDGGWSWGLDLVSYGRGDTQRTIDGTASVATHGTRVEYHWNPSLTEWYINDQNGFEHGYTLHERPEAANDAHSVADAMLHFTLAVRGNLCPRVSENGRDVAFTTGIGSDVLNYNDLKVFDADGLHLAASFQSTTTSTGTPALLLTIDDTNARYPLTIDPTAQQAYLKAFVSSSVDPEDRFGSSVSVLGNTVVVGAPFEDSNATGMSWNQASNTATNSGAAYVFVRSTGGNTWAIQAYLKPSNTGADDSFGYSVAVSENTIVVGAPFEDSNATSVDGNGVDNSASGSGAAYVFVRPSGGNTWTQQAYLKASNTGENDNFGSAVAVSINTIVVGAPLEDSNANGVNGNADDNSAGEAGAAYVFVRPSGGTTWTQQAYLKASNTGASDNFGSAVTTTGERIVVGAPREDSNTTGVNGNQANNSAEDSGAAYVFTRAGTTWSQQAYLKASNSGSLDQFGLAVSLSGDNLVVGAPFESSNATGVNGNQADNTAPQSGAAYVFIRSPSLWSQQAYLKASNTDKFDQFGFTVAISGSTVVVGAPFEDSHATGINGDQLDNRAIDSGAAYVFTRNVTNWSQQAFLKASNTDANDHFAKSVAISGDVVVFGAENEDSSTTGVNNNQADNSEADAGAAYVLVRNALNWTQQAYVKPASIDSNREDSFGSSVAISGDTVVIGAPNEDSSATGVNGHSADVSEPDSGAAYVFVRTAAVGGSVTAWTQQAYLKASNTGFSDKFGWSVAISGDTIVVGATEEDSNATGVNGNQLDNSTGNSGAAYVFVRTGDTWTQQAYIKASNTRMLYYFGNAVAVSGDTIVIGAYRQISRNIAGEAYVFVRSVGGTVWNQQAYLIPSNAGPDAFGEAVAVSGDTIIVGAPSEASNATGVDGDGANNNAHASGAAYVFVRPSGGTVWTQQAYLKASNSESLDYFGRSVAVSGDTIVVGAPDEDSDATGVNGSQTNNFARDSGAAYIFVRTGTIWRQQAYLKASNTEAFDYFGNDVAVSGDTIVVGAFWKSSLSGAAYVFVRPPGGTAWTQQTSLKASNAGRDDSFGGSVAVSGDTVVIGAYSEDSNATGVNGVETDNSAFGSGAAYVFLLGPPTPTNPLAVPAVVCSGSPMSLSVANPATNIVIDWFTGSCGGTLIGTGNPFNVTPTATTTYFARARNTSNGNTSDACASATVTVRGPADPACCPCPADFDASGGTPDSTDISAFFNAWLLGDPTADTDCSGGTPDTQDIQEFFSAWLAGGC
jgi:hypothetical protein